MDNPLRIDVHQGIDGVKIVVVEMDGRWSMRWFWKERTLEMGVEVEVRSWENHDATKTASRVKGCGGGGGGWIWITRIDRATRLFGKAPLDVSSTKTSWEGKWIISHIDFISSINI